MSRAHRNKLLKKSKVAYAQLDEMQWAILEQKYIQGSMNAGAWLEKLRSLADFDFYAEEYVRKTHPVRQNYFNLTIGGTLSYYFILFIFGLWLTEKYPIPPLLVFVFLSLPLIPWLMFLVHPYAKLKKKDLPNYLHHLLIPLVGILKEELRPQQELEIYLNLRPIVRQKHESLNERLKIKAQKFNKSNESTLRSEAYLEYPIMTLRTRLWDKKHLQIQSYLEIRERKRLKLKGNKYKLRVKLIHQISLKTPPSQSGEDSKPIRLKDKMEIEFYQTTRSEKNNYQSEYRALQLKMEDPEALNAQAVLALIAKLYHSSTDPI